MMNDKERVALGSIAASAGLTAASRLTGSAQNSRGRKSWVADRGSRWRNAVVIHRRMIKSLEQATAEVANLPEADQEQIGRRLLVHVEKLRQLRAEIDKGIRSLDAGEGKPLELEDFLRQVNERHGRA